MFASPFLGCRTLKKCWVSKASGEATRLVDHWMNVSTIVRAQARDLICEATFRLSGLTMSFSAIGGC